jgi:hypothetical protein
MILGMSTAAFTTLHVIISLIGIATGLVVVLAMCAGKRLPGWTALFLVTTVLTSVTGFLFHSTSFGPPHVVGVISLIVLALAIVGLYVHHLAGAWRWIYIVTAVLALYLNAFVGVVQAFQKIDFLRALAPTQKEPPFLIAQLLLLACFVVIAVIAVKRFPARTVRAVV